MDKEPIIEVRHMVKNFGPTRALRDVDVSFYRGEIRGLVGENGSGKSTITSIVAGMQKATSGEMFYKGDPWNPASMVDAQLHGISMVLQEANTIPNCTVAENIFAGRFNEFAVANSFLSMRKVNKAAQELLDSFGLSRIRATDNINKYGFEDRKLIEIVRCVSDETEVFVVDETTTALSHEGRQILYKLIHRLKDENKSVIFISHDMDEILEQCTDLTILRDGEIKGSLTREEMDAPDAVKRIRFLMVGREIGDAYYREDYDTSHLPEVALKLDHVSFGPIKDFSLELHKGEIIGFGGLSGCGMHDIGRAAFGLEKLAEGSVTCNGKEIKSCLDAIEAGVGYISKNRDTEALILDGSIADNIVLPSINALAHGTFVSPRDEKKLANAEIDNFRIKCYGGKQWVNTLSGGNKQKVSFSKWTAKKSDVLIMDCPTRGVDIGVKQFMYHVIAEMKQQGKSIILISEELAELIGMADKILIMKDFEVTHEFKRDPKLSETDIIEYMI
jgi:ribose transport system ATP-binding protein